MIPDCFNFKVRINAAMSLAIPRERANYGNDYSALWESLTKALVVSEVTNDFTEYRYLDNLIEQVNLTDLMNRFDYLVMIRF